MDDASRIFNIEDARGIARRRMPKMFFDYLDGGSFGENTLRANVEEFHNWNLRQQALTGIYEIDLATCFLGRRNALPFMLGPIGFLGLFRGRGELLAASAAADAGIAFALSSFAIATVEQLRAASAGPLHFQLYVLRDRRLADELLDRAAAARCEAIYVTVDTAITAVRERDSRNGFRTALKLSPGLLARFAMSPRWCFDMARAGPLSVGVARGRPEFGQGVLAQAANLSRQIDPSVCWEDIARIRKRWAARLVIKGILDPSDAVRAIEVGADAIVVSNHGGRQLDGACATILSLAEIARAVDGRIDILIDGGFRRGQDIIKALALGASGVLLGRAYAYALAAAGGEGVRRIIALLTEEIRISLALMGLRSVEELKQRGAGSLLVGRSASGPADPAFP
jgi:isopentenyl diphosphate isomerase/L-lactate dehydrogenase-like FMN-dependent dehydrogenase